MNPAEVIAQKSSLPPPSEHLIRVERHDLGSVCRDETSTPVREIGSCHKVAGDGTSLWHGRRSAGDEVEPTCLNERHLGGTGNIPSCRRERYNTYQYFVIRIFCIVFFSKYCSLE